MSVTDRLGTVGEGEGRGTGVPRPLSLGELHSLLGALLAGGQHPDTPVAVVTGERHSFGVYSLGVQTGVERADVDGWDGETVCLDQTG
jgi:hypothetical protein